MEDEATPSKPKRKTVVPLKTLLLTNIPVYLLLLGINFEAVLRVLQYSGNNQWLVITMVVLRIALYLYWAVLPILLLVTFARLAGLLGKMSLVVPFLILAYYFSTAIALSSPRNPALFTLMVLFTSILVLNWIVIGRFRLPVLYVSEPVEKT